MARSVKAMKPHNAETEFTEHCDRLMLVLSSFRSAMRRQGLKLTITTQANGEYEVEATKVEQSRSV